MIPLSELIKKLRKKRGLTQKQLAEILGITFQSLQQWEKGIANPSSKRFAALAEALGVTVNELITGVIQEETKPEPQMQEITEKDIPAGQMLVSIQEILEMQKRINELQSELLKYKEKEIERQRSLRPN